MRQQSPPGSVTSQDSKRQFFDYAQVVQREVSRATGMDIRLIEGSPAQGFPFVWTLDEKFNIKTFTYINRLASLTREGLIEFGDPLTNVYSTVVNALDYRLSQSDQGRRSEAMRMAISTYEATYGEITAEILKQAKQPTKFDYILSLMGTSWSDRATGNLTPSAYPGVAKAPAAAGPVIEQLAIWDHYTSLTADAGRTKAQILRNIRTPQLDNGGMTTMDSQGRTSLRLGFLVHTSTLDIWNNLKNENRKIVIELTEADNPLALAGIRNLERSGLLGAGTVSSATVGGNGQGARITFCGYVLVAFEPMPWDISSGTGWFYSYPIQEAISQADPDATGFHFNPRPNIDFGPEGTFGILTAVLISQRPTVEWLGAAPTDVTAPSAPVTELSAKSAPLDDIAYVIGGAVTFPFASSKTATTTSPESRPLAVESTPVLQQLPIGT